MGILSVLRNRRVIDISHPLQARHYLMLLRDDQTTGIRVRENLSIPKGRLGFSFSSNRLGLRGPHDITAQNVVLGTSFAMGLAVDDGSNWYDRCLPASNWFNAGLPVGLTQIEALLDAYIPGKRQACLFVYHPNIWWVSHQYAALKLSEGGAFATFGWKTGYLECLRLSYKRRRALQLKLQSGQNIMFRHQGHQYHVDCKYCRFDFEANSQIVDETVETFRRIMSRFARAIVVRVPVKQELVLAPYSSNSHLAKTVASYDFGWDLLRERTADLGWIRFHKLAEFELGDYQAYDTHWNDAGNEKFARVVQRTFLPALQEQPKIVQDLACSG
jgi:hypothetical protein